MDKKIIKQIFSYGLKEKYNLYLTENRYYNTLNIVTPGDNVPADSSPIKSEEQLNYILKEKNISGFRSEAKDFNVNAFIDIFNSNSADEQKFMISNITEYLGYSWNESIIYVLSKTTKNYKEALSVINGFSISTLHMGRVEFKKIDNLLESFNPNENDMYKFWLKFFKQRKNQAKSALYGPKMSNFLIDKYGRDEKKLAPFCEFSNHLKSEFEELEFKLEEDAAKHVTAFRINCRKASQILCIPNYTEGKIQTEIKNFMNGLKKLWKLEKIDVVDFDRHKGIIEVRMYNNEKAYAQEEVTGLLKDFLVHKKTIPEIETNDNLVNNWMLKKDLTQSLSEEPIKANKKMKI